MGTIALDIETGSPFEEPPVGDNSTEYYEWLSVALSYDDGKSGSPETTVLFREGGWGDDHTADLFDRLFDWCDDRTVDRILTYNGAWFDLKHLANWATALEESGMLPGTYTDLERAIPHHIDLALVARDTHEDELQDGQPILPDWLAYKLESIDNDSIWYEDYAFNDDYWSNLNISDKFVKGEHVGTVLAERYVDGVVAGLDETSTHQELRRLLYDYSVSDVEDMFALYEALGAEALDEAYHIPLAEVKR